MKTTNKPEVVAWIWDYRGRHMATTDYSQALELAEPPYPTEVEPLIRLADYQRLQADHERLQAECEKLRKDAERLDFIAQHPGWLRSHKGRWGCVSPFTNYSYPVFKTPRDAIDAAMQEERNP